MKLKILIYTIKKNHFPLFSNDRKKRESEMWCTSQNHIFHKNGKKNLQVSKNPLGMYKVKKNFRVNHDTRLN